MNVATFLANSLSHTVDKTSELCDQSNPWKIICFKSKVYPLLFFSRFFVQYAQFNSAVLNVDFTLQDLETFFGELQISFLGQSQIYWCKNISQLDAIKRKKFVTFVQSYQGPHRLIFFTSDAVNLTSQSEAIILDLDDGVDQKLYQEIYPLLYPARDIGASNAFVKSLFSGSKKMTFDQACHMMQYHAAVGERDREICTQWLDRLIVPDKSLFTLSQYLFAKNSGLFMKFWQKLEDDFPPEFWIAFWSEQFWQASIFVGQAFDHGPVAARKSVNRLPFSFMQRDYKSYKVRELTVAHNFLYSIDHGLKNGHATFGLELFFTHFLQGNFSRK